MSRTAQTIHKPANPAPPADWIAGLKQNWRVDIMSGFIIFLIALPLSVGISLASGAPATAGLLTAIVGGMLGAVLGGSYLTINGPAAGLIVVVLGAVTSLGQGDMQLGFRKTLAAFVVAGVLQICFGALRLGVLGLAVPTSVIHGMLAAIGAIIFAKQVHLIFGVTPHSKDIFGMFGEIPHSILNLNPDVAIVGGVSFAILIAFRIAKSNWAKRFPAPLLVAIVGIAIGKYFDFDHEHLVKGAMVGPKYLLNIPQTLSSAFIFPDFSDVFTLNSIRWSVALALIASIESLLTAFAIDKMDPHGRSSNLDRELASKGICNTVLALIGGLPLIAEIIRSSANVRNGAQTRWANFAHGLFILGFLAAFPGVLHEIPLAALAAILCMVGWNLSHPSQFQYASKIGLDHFAAFLTTFLVTVGSDLLVGVFCGIVVELISNLMRGQSLSALFRVRTQENRNSGETRIYVKSPATFTNYLSLKKTLDKLKGEKKVVLDLSEAKLVDHTVLDHLEKYRMDFLKAGAEFRFEFSSDHKASSAHPLAARRHKAL